MNTKIIAIMLLLSIFTACSSQVELENSGESKSKPLPVIEDEEVVDLGEITNLKEEESSKMEEELKSNAMANAKEIEGMELIGADNAFLIYEGEGVFSGKLVEKGDMAGSSLICLEFNKESQEKFAAALSDWDSVMNYACIDTENSEVEIDAEFGTELSLTVSMLKVLYRETSGYSIMSVTSAE